MLGLFPLLRVLAARRTTENVRFQSVGLVIEGQLYIQNIGLTFYLIQTREVIPTLT